MVEYLTQQQLQQLLDLAKAPRDQLLLRVQYETGCTVSELVDIRREDLKPTGIEVDDRFAHTSTALLEDLRAYAQTHESPYLFPSRQRPQLTPKRVQQITKKYLRELDATDKKTPHILRYTHIAHAVEQSIPFSAIQAQTGLGELRLSQIIQEIETPKQEAYGRMFA